MVSYQQTGRIFDQTSMSNEAFLGSLGYTVDTVYSWLNGSTQDIVDSFNTGIAFANYRGHGWYTGWHTPSFEKTDISGIARTEKK